MDVKIVENNYNKIRGILKNEYFRQKEVMLDAEVEAFHKDSNPLTDKRFWILKTAVLLYPKKEVETILLDNGYDRNDIEIIKKVLESAKEEGTKKDLGKRLCNRVYSH